MEIPTLSEEERQKLFMGMWFGAMMGPRGFIMRKLGPEAMEELNAESAASCVADLKARGVDNPLQFAMSYAIINKNIFGSDVAVNGTPEKATLAMNRCSITLRRHWNSQREACHSQRNSIAPAASTAISNALQRI